MLADAMRTGVTEIRKEAAVRRDIFSLFAKAIGKGDAKAIQGLLKQHGKNLSNIEKQTLSKMQFKDSKGVSSIFDFTSGKFAPVKPPAVQPKVAPAVQPKAAPAVQPKVAPAVQPKAAPVVQPKVAPVVQSTAPAAAVDVRTVQAGREAGAVVPGTRVVPQAVPQVAPAVQPVVDKTIEKELTTASKTDAVRKVMDAADDADPALLTAGKTDAVRRVDVPLQNRAVKEPPVNWTDKWTQQYDKDPLKTLALTGGGVYAGSRVLENVFGNKQAAADLEYIMKFKQHRGIL